MERGEGWGEGWGFTARFWHTPAMILDFAPRLIAWQRQWGRHDLPWQAHAPGDAYPVWVSEIMLQQTQVETVLPYYRKFMARFPDVTSLAAASEDEVLAHWSGLGYYSRARNLHGAARQVVERHGGRFPQTPEALLALPGIGRSTAAAIGAFAFGQRAAILDGNVKRVLARIFGVEGWPGEKPVENRLWRLAESLLPDKDVAPYTQGLMDLGATLCTRSRPRCEACPFRAQCVACLTGRQKELPVSRPRKALPERRVGMLVLLHAGEVLVVKRPAVGVWGGLWSLPECGADEDAGDATRRLGLVPGEILPLAPRVHGFTHFRLHIQPWRVAVEAHDGRLREGPGQLWVPLPGLNDYGLPAPVRRILGAI
jgi:A/G-specific adenine glycosylase